MTESAFGSENAFAAAEDRSLHDLIIEYFTHRQIRITPLDLERLIVSANPFLARSVIRSSIKQLISEGLLGYCCHNALTALELSFGEPVRVGRRISLCSSGQRDPVEGDRVLIRMVAGASFGSGNHPTTQLCLQGLEFALDYYESCFNRDVAAVIDIGTGTGILAIAAALLGVKKVLATDIDPVARYEARQNVEENGLGPDQVIVVDPADHEPPSAVFDLVLANLRPPTLRHLFDEMLSMTGPGGFWVVSGFRPAEAGWINSSATERSGRVVWRDQLKGWAAVAIQWL